MKKIVTLLIALSFLATGCGKEQPSNAEDTSSSLEQQEGMIVDIRATEDGWSQMLVVPDVSEEDISNKKGEELINIAQDEGGAYYSFETSKYEELKVGVRVIVHWNGEQLDSDPPQRGMEKIDVVSE